MAKNVLTEDQRWACVEMRKDGMTLQQIADEFGISKAAVGQLIHSRAPELNGPGYFGPATELKLRKRCVYPGLADRMIKNRVTPCRLGRMAGIDDHVNIYGMLFGKHDMRKKSIDKLLTATGLTYEEAFGGRTA